MAKTKTVRMRDSLNSAAIPRPSKNIKIVVWGVALSISILTVIVFLRAMQNGFVNWDDNEYIYKNLNIQSINFDFFRWSLTAVVASLWHPLTLLSLAVDYSIWGLNPFGYHLTNVILHAANTLLVFFLADRLVNFSFKSSLEKESWEKLIPAVITALLFGIHPLRVESVAWVSERKDVLCALFFLSAALTYLRYVSSETKKKKAFYYICGVFLFILALLSKPMAVSLPVVLLILDIYPLKRLSVDKGMKIEKFVLVLMEKVPFFILSLTTSLITLHAAQEGGALTAETYPLLPRIFVAMQSYIFYISKMYLPWPMAPLYPYPKEGEIFKFAYIGQAILFAGITTFIIWRFNKHKVFAAAWFYYIVTLLPVIGIVKVGGAAAADRYTYLPSIGPFLLMGLGVVSIYKVLPGKIYKGMLASALLILAGLLAERTVSQIEVWHDSITLWTHEINLYADTYIPYLNRGGAYRDKGNYQEAIVDFSKAIELNSKDERAYNNRGVVYRDKGEYQAAVADFTRAIELNTSNVDAYDNRGAVYGRLSKYQEAISDFTRAISINPKHASAYNDRGISFLAMGNYQEALVDLKKAVELNPSNAMNYNNLGVVHSSMGDYQHAITIFNKAIEIDPRCTSAYISRGDAYLELGDFQKAALDLSKAIELEPGNAKAFYLLGDVYRKNGNAELGQMYFKKASDMGYK